MKRARRSLLQIMISNSNFGGDMWKFEDFGSNLSIIDENGITISYSELKHITDEITRHINKRCLVFSLCENTVGSVVGYTSFINNRVVPVLLSASLDIELLDSLLSTYCPEYIWLPNSIRGRFPDATVQYSCYDYSLIKTDYANSFKLYDELALLLTTSGSTGSPKLVRQSYNNVRSNAESIVEYLELNSTERPITTLPMNYTYGLSIINSHLMVGATLLVTSKGIMQKEFWQFFREQNATSFGGVPYTYEMLDRLRFYRMKLPSLRYMTQAGGKITETLHKKFAEYAKDNSKKFVVMYGQCEATARMGYLPYDMAIEKCGSMGIAIPGGKFALIDSEGNIVEHSGITGELIYEGENVTLGYAERGEDLALGDERHGILHTGDMAKRDEDGFYYIVGRKKRFLKIFGNRVNLDEIDRLIKDKFDNTEVASSGIDDHMYIFVTNHEQSEDIRNFVIHMTKLNPTAFKIVVIDEIPKNDSGKVLYRELAKYYEDAQ